VIVLLVGAVVAVALIAAPRHATPAAPAATPPLPRHPPRHPPRAWLGLDYNSNSGIGRLDEFSRRGIIYDREGSIEVYAGSTAGPGTSLGQGLARSYGAGMIPDIEVDPHAGPLGCTDDPQPIKYCLPTSAGDVSTYIHGFVDTATSILRRFPHRQVLFEPMNEPWDWPAPAGSASGRHGAQEYASLLVRLLAVSTRAQIPLADIYVQATGQLSDGTSWIPDLYAAEPCLRPGGGTCGPIEGWSVHPYGLPGSSTNGIDSVPVLHREMLSGRSNVVITEIGFCADNVEGGAECSENSPDIAAPSDQAARWLAQTLAAAAKMHAQGWLKALLVWQRGGGGWAMQNPNGTLTAQGRELELFAASRAAQ
jgi:hypothetical protein